MEERDVKHFQVESFRMEVQDEKHFQDIGSSRMGGSSMGKVTVFWDIKSKDCFILMIKAQRCFETSVTI
jgi:hypothetical protein